MQITRCPHCGVAFRVASDQLRVRNGLVRCGECHTVFDGYAGLVQPGSPAWALPAGSEPGAGPATDHAPKVIRNRAGMMPPHHADSAPPPLPGDDAEDFLDARQAFGTSPRIPAEPVVAAEPVVPAGAAMPAEPILPGPSGPAVSARDDDEFADGASHDAGQGERILGESRTRLIDALDSGRSPPPFMDDAERAGGRWARTAWAIAAAVALLLLLAQGLMVYRTQLALAFPVLRPALSWMCEPLECRVGYARRIERISIMSSSLQRSANGTAHDGALVLHVVMRNRYDLPQEWPALMLTLTDMSDTVVARRALRPRDYLPMAPDQDPGPFGAGQEVTLAVPIDPGALSVNGYRIDKFFP